MEFRLLGPLEAWQDNQRVHLGDRQQRYLLAALLLEANKPVSVDRLIKIIWDREWVARDTTTTLINTYTSRLRNIFRKAGAHDVQLDKEPSSFRILRVDTSLIDYFRFYELRELAGIATRSGDDGRALTLLHEAQKLWRGDFLADLENDTLRGPYQEKLKSVRLDMLYELAELEFYNGNYSWVIDHLQEVVATTPLHEGAAVLLGRAMLERQDRVGALQVAQLAIKALSGKRMVPSADLRKVYDRALRGEPVHIPKQLPRKSRLFFGRKDELDKLLTGWQSVTSERETPSILSITGMPGVGKTTLAVHVAHRLTPHFPDGQLFINMHGFTPKLDPISTSTALERLLKTLGVPGAAIPEDLDDRAALYRSTLAGTRRLIVLDNVLDEQQVDLLLPGSGSSLVIITAHRRLSAVDHVRSVHLDPLLTADAVAFLRESIGASRFDGQWEAAEQMVELCGGLPLAIQMIGCRLAQHRNCPLRHYVDLLQKQESRLAELDPAERRMAAVFYVSYERLDPAQQRVFRLLGAVPGPDFDTAAVAALADFDTGGVLEALYEASLLEDSEDARPGRYRLHDLLRSYAMILGEDNPSEQEAAVTRLLYYYLHTASAAAAAAYPHDRHRLPPIASDSTVCRAFDTDQDGLDWLWAEYRNVVVAVRYAAQCGWHEFTWKLACAIWRYLYIRGHLDDWADTLQLALDAARQSADTRGQALVLQHLSAVYWRSGNSQQALDHGCHALQLWEELGDRHGAADVCCVLGLCATRLGRFDEAREHYHRAMHIYAELNDQRGYANVLDNLGNIDERCGLLQPALKRHAAALSILQTLRDPQGELYVLNNMGGVQQRLEQLEEAVELHQRALAISEEIEYLHGRVFSLNYLAAAYRRMGNRELATDYHDRALDIARKLRDPTVGADVHNEFGETCRAWGEYDRAAERHRLALHFAEETDNVREQARAHHGIASATHAQGRHQVAANHWQKAIDLYGSIKVPEADQVAAELDALDCSCRTL